jgi:hypothetical protein
MESTEEFDLGENSSITVYNGFVYSGGDDSGLRRSLHVMGEGLLWVARWNLPNRPQVAPHQVLSHTWGQASKHGAAPHQR